MTTYNTGNPIGSKDPRDLYDNAENLDEAVNTRTAESWDDRFGVARKTWWGMEQDFQQFLINSGYQNIGDYAAGLEITARNQIFWRDGELYRAGAVLELPYTTTGDWGDEEGLFVAVGDQALRQDLANPNAGGRLIAGAVTVVESVLDLLSISDPKPSSIYFTKSFYAGAEKGGSAYVWDPNLNKGYADGGAVIDPSSTGGFTGTHSTLNNYLSAQGTSSGSGCWVRQDMDGTILVESFGATGVRGDDVSQAFRACFDSAKGTGLVVRDTGGEHTIEQSITIYNSAEFVGDIHLLMGPGRQPRIVIGDEELEPYDTISPAIPRNLNMLNRDLDIPVEYAGRYIRFITSETISRRNASSQTYPINYSGQIVPKDGPGPTAVFPRLPITYDRDLFTEVRVYKKRGLVTTSFRNFIVDCSELTATHSGWSPLAIERDNVDFRFEHIEQIEGPYSYNNCFSIRSNCVRLKGKTLSHFSDDGGDVYPVLLSGACDVVISDVQVYTNSPSSFSSGNSYNVTLDGVSGVSAGCHFGGHWVIRNSKFSENIQHGGSDLYVYGSEAKLITNRQDYCHLAGDLVVEDTKIFRRTGTSTPAFRLRVDNSPLGGGVNFDYGRTWVLPDLVKLHNITIDSNRDGNIYSLFTIQAATLNGTENVIVDMPKVIDVRNISGQSGNLDPGDSQDEIILFNYLVPKRTPTGNLQISLNFENIDIRKFNNNTDHVPLICISTWGYPVGYISQGSDIQFGFSGAFRNIHNRTRNVLVAWTAHFQEMLFENILNATLGGRGDPVPGDSSLGANRERVRFSNVWFNKAEAHLKHGRFEYINCTFELGFHYDPSGSYKATIDRVIGCVSRQSAQTTPPVSSLDYYANPDLYIQV